jgi:hypothetical protein
VDGSAGAGLVAGAPAVDADPQLGARAAYFKQALRDKLIDHKHYEIELPEGMTYRAGDYLAVLPTNP